MKTPKHSAGLLVHRKRNGNLEVLLAHPGGPFWSRRDLGAWTIPKGLIGVGEDPLVAARREFAEETGIFMEGCFENLGTFRQPGGKVLHVWAIEGDCDVSSVRSNLFEMEWPPRSGQMVQFPEIDRAQWFALPDALVKILEGQQPAIEKLVVSMRSRGRGKLPES